MNGKKLSIGNSDYHYLSIWHDKFLEKGNQEQVKRGRSIKMFYHRELGVILRWQQMLKKIACNQSFESYYTLGRKLGSGKFSKVYQCQSKITDEIAAVKVISKKSMSAKEMIFLREEI